MRVDGKRIPLFLVIAVLLIATVSAAFKAQPVYAAQITDRSLTLEAGATAGGSAPGGTVDHFFEFTLPDATNIGSILFEYCTEASGAGCTTPTNMDATGASLANEAGVTGFTFTSVDANTFYLAQSGAPANVGSSVPVSYRIADVINTDDVNTTFFVRITTYASLDTTGGVTDSGTVAASTADEIVLTGIMPESLIFCTGEAISLGGNGSPDCSTATAGDIAFAELFSSTETRTATSQMAATTNAGSGYIITVAGDTLTSGSNTIPAIGSTAAASQIGQGQFGLNLVENDGVGPPTGPLVGSPITPASNGTNYRANPATNFGAANTYAFDGAATNIIARSDNGTPGSPAPTDAQRYTVSYLVNVSGSQTAGTYTTTLTYVCTPTF